MSCTASTFMQLPFRKGGNGTESLLSLSAAEVGPLNQKSILCEKYAHIVAVYAHWPFCRIYKSHSGNKIKDNLQKFFFYLKHILSLAYYGQQVLIISFLFMCFCGMSWDWRLILLFQQCLRNERLFSLVLLKSRIPSQGLLYCKRTLY